jgi:hypothetical protein
MVAVNCFNWPVMPTRCMSKGSSYNGKHYQCTEDMGSSKAQLFLNQLVSRK